MLLHSGDDVLKEYLCGQGVAMVDNRLHIWPIPTVNLQTATASSQSTVPHAWTPTHRHTHTQTHTHTPTHTQTSLQAHTETRADTHTLSCGRAMISTYNVRCEKL